MQAGSSRGRRDEKRELAPEPGISRLQKIPAVKRKTRNVDWTKRAKIIWGGEGLREERQWGFQ